MVEWLDLTTSLSRSIPYGSHRQKMDCVDLGKDFFLIKFMDDEDYDKVLRGGPWFVGEHFLAIKP